MVRVTDLTATDRLMGVVMALLKTCFIILAVYAAASPFLPENWYEGSTTMTAAAKVWPYVRDLLEKWGLLDFSVLCCTETCSHKGCAEKNCEFSHFD